MGALLHCSQLKTTGPPLISLAKRSAVCLPSHVLLDVNTMKQRNLLASASARVAIVVLVLPLWTLP